MTNPTPRYCSLFDAASRLASRQVVLAGLALGSAWPVSAHEFWMLPDAFRVAPGGSTTVSLTVGENFDGFRVGIVQPLVAGFRQYARGRTIDLGTAIPVRPMAEVPVALPTAGTHVFALDTHPSEVTLGAEKFHAYLHDEGLDRIVALREAAGTAATPGRERFRRNVKTLVQVGGQPDAGHAVRTGQRLEVLPLANPYRLRAGGTLGVQVLFDGQPLPGVLVKSWHRKGAQTLIIRTVTDDDGKVEVTLPWSGTWMASVVHMIPATDAPGIDWDSHWGNLSFELPASKAAAR